MSDANRVRISQIKEATYGVTPSGSLSVLRLTGESLEQTTETVESEEIRADRRTSDVARTNIQAAGDINFELHYGSYDALFEAVLQANTTWSAPVTAVANDNAISVANGRYKGIDEEFTAYSVGEWVWVSGFANAANNGYKKIIAINSTNPGTLDNDEMVVEGGALVNVSAGPGVSITQLGSIKDGTTQAAYSIEREYQDVPNVFAKFSGMMYNTLTLTAEAQGRVTGSFGLIGKKQEMVAATIGTGYTLANTNKIYNTVDHVKSAVEGGTPTTSLGFSLSLNNNLDGRQEIASLGAVSISSGPISLSGTFRRYFTTIGMIDKYLNFDESSVAFLFNSASGGGYIFDIPAIHYTQGRNVAGGRGQDVIADMAFTALADASEGIMFRIARNPAA